MNPVLNLEKEAVCDSLTFLRTTWGKRNQMSKDMVEQLVFKVHNILRLAALSPFPISHSITFLFMPVGLQLPILGYTWLAVCPGEAKHQITQI